MRYAFAFGAITAGFVCYRLVPGQVRYLAVLVSMVLAAIYISEGRQHDTLTHFKIATRRREFFRRLPVYYS